MGIVELILGYKNIKKNQVNKDILKILDKKIKQHRRHSIGFETFKINGRTFRYRIKIPRTKIEYGNHGEIYYSFAGKIKYYRKLK